MRLFIPTRTVLGTLFAAILLLSGCACDERVAAIGDERPLPIAFDAYLRQSQSGTRATMPREGDDDSHIATNLTTKALRDWGFGVFAQYAGTNNMDINKAAPFNFMFNQKVEWKDGAWAYAPTKYWPNDNNPADPIGASGSQTHSYLHFFAYAPYYDYSKTVKSNDDPTTATPKSGFENKDNFGITNMSGNSASNPYLIYRSHLEFGKDIDLLWAVADRQYKTDEQGEGTTTGAVQLNFKHALSKMKVTVMALVDHATTSDSPTQGYAGEVDANTRILVEKLQIKNLPDRGRLYFAPKEDDAQWVAYTQGNTSALSSIIDGEPSPVFNPAVAFTRDPNGNNVTGEDQAALDDVQKALADFEQLPSGVSHTPQELFLADDGKTPLFFLFPPTKNHEGKLKPLEVVISYKVITYDPRLALNSPKYFSIVENKDITSTLNLDFDFEPNKQYTLRLLLGLTSVKFEVGDVSDWQEDASTNHIDIDTNPIATE